MGVAVMKHQAAEGRCCLGSQFEGTQFIMAGKAQRQESEATGHIVSAVGKQKRSAPSPICMQSVTPARETVLLIFRVRLPPSNNLM